MSELPYWVDTAPELAGRELVYLEFTKTPDYREELMLLSPTTTPSHLAVLHSAVV